VLGRVSNLWAAVKSAASAEISVYKLGVKEECQAKVESLLKGDAFHYPGRWSGIDDNVRIRISLR